MASRFFPILGDGVGRQVRRFFAVDSGGTPRQIRRAFVCDANGVGRQFFTAAHTFIVTTTNTGPGLAVGYSEAANWFWGTAENVTLHDGKRVWAYIERGDINSTSLTLANCPTNPGQNYVRYVRVVGLPLVLDGAAATFRYNAVEQIAQWDWSGRPGMTSPGTFQVEIGL